MLNIESIGEMNMVFIKAAWKVRFKMIMGWGPRVDRKQIHYLFYVKWTNS